MVMHLCWAISTYLFDVVHITSAYQYEIRGCGELLIEWFLFLSSLLVEIFRNLSWAMKKIVGERSTARFEEVRSRHFAFTNNEKRNYFFIIAVVIVHFL